MPFNIGPGELIVILIVALLLFGPKKLPELGKAMGESIGAFKKAINGTPSGNANNEGTVAPAPSTATSATATAPAQVATNPAGVTQNAAPQQITVATPDLSTSVGSESVPGAAQNVGVSGATSADVNGSH